MMRFTSYFDEAATWAEDLVNTRNIIRDVEKMADVADLGRFLIDHGLRIDGVPSTADLDRARRLRPILRRVFETDDEDAAVEILNGVIADHHGVPHYVRHDGLPWHLHVSTDDHPAVDQYAANAAMGLLAVITSTGLNRLHTCGGNRCAEVFVDISRNQSRRYCSPLICGNRAHAAAHRARQKSVQPSK
ncbi:CGNR zinc finger domain-containing protein [Streptomyces sp. NPDC002599]|uniref:CGNR zinc finger domain-containing protein n=1 Tax=Streptomyces sp. NPDC002599 TaxID=3154421 RepID=UPI0033172F6A